MSRSDINHEHRYTEDEREYLEARGMGYLIQQNERIYGKEGDPEPEEPGRNPDSENAKKLVEEQRAADAAAKKTVEGTPARGPLPPVPPSGDQLSAEESLDNAGATSIDDDEDGIDDDISDYADSFTIEELKKRLDDEEVEYPSKAKHDEYAELYANVLQDKRDAGETLDLTKDE